MLKSDTVEPFAKVVRRKNRTVRSEKIVSGTSVELLVII